MTPEEILSAYRIGLGATVDGYVPFGDPMKNTFEIYKDCEAGATEARFLGEVSRDILPVAAAEGAASKLLSPILAKTAMLGKGSRLFWRGGKYGLKGILNGNNYLRMGWSWKGCASNGKDVFRIAIGSTPKNLSAGAKRAIDWYRHIDL